ncbi:hypothetical protein EYC08_18290 [Tabrizicola sp. WMC-M-20]|nr:hypothetical protein EYC08_18290 [Tabrizicola sp. WMC-M-20]
MAKPKSIVETIREVLAKSSPKVSNPTAKQIMEGLAVDIDAQVKKGMRLDDIYDIIRAGLPEDRKMTRSTFRRYWREARDAAGLPKIKNSGKKKEPVPRPSSAPVAPAAEQTAIPDRAFAQQRTRTSSDFRHDPDDF